MAFSRFRIALDLTIEEEGPLAAAHPSLAYLQPSKPSRYWKPWIASICHDEDDPAATLLRNLTTEILDILCNAKDYTHPTIAKYVDPNFEANKDGGSYSSSTGAGHIGTTAANAKRMPNLSAEILSSVAKVHENGRQAEVWAWLRMHGLPVSDAKVKLEGETVKGDGIVKECVSVLQWEMRREQWICVSGKVMRGVSGI